MTTQIILLERVDNLGQLGDVVNVKPGYARNYLLPQKKALRATKENLAYFDAQKKHLEKENENKKKGADVLAAKIADLKVPLIRQASESGQLYGSVTSRDIAAEITATSGEQIDRAMVVINRNYKTLGLFPVDVILHPEVKVSVTINIARSAEEAAIQAESGKALISGREEEEADAQAEELDAIEQLEEVLEDTALEAEKEKLAAEAETQASSANENADTADDADSETDRQDKE